MIRWGASVGHPSSVLVMDVENPISGQIRVWTRHRGEALGSWVNHYAFLCRDALTLIEALFRGVTEGTLEYYSESETTWGIIVEHVGFSLDEHALAEGAARGLLGQPYSVVAIVKQFVDGLVSKLLGRDWYGARRLEIPGISTTICSQLGVTVHKVGGWTFMGLRTVYRKVQRGFMLRLYAEQILDELPARRASPDCIWDDIFEHRPSLYRIAGEINPHLRPPDLPVVIASKIDRDLAFDLQEG